MNEKIELILKLHKEGRITNYEAMILITPELRPIEIPNQEEFLMFRNPWRVDFPQFPEQPYYVNMPVNVS